MKATIKLTFVVVTAGLVLFTIVQSLTSFPPVAPLKEYRRPAPAPDVVAAWVHGDGRAAAGINAWFDDRIGLRPLLTRFANEIAYSVFGYSRKVLIGKDGWLFERATTDALVSHERLMQDLELDRQKLDALSAYLHRRDIKLIVISTPAKEATLTDLLPADAPHLPSKRRFERLRELLKAGDGKRWLYIDSKDVLEKAHIGVNEMYYRTDLHMTAEATEPIVHALLDRIAESEGMAWRWQARMDYIPDTFDTGAALRFLSVFTYPSEHSTATKHELRYSPDRPLPGEVVVNPPPAPFEFVLHNSSPSARLPPTVLYGNSFLDLYLVFGAYSNFKDVYRVRHGAGKLEPTLRAIPPGTRYFVYQFWELHSTVLRDATIPPE
jgi:hypothetical protein